MEKAKEDLRYDLLYKIARLVKKKKVRYEEYESLLKSAQDCKKKLAESNSALYETIQLYLDMFTGQTDDLIKVLNGEEIKAERNFPSDAWDF